MKDRTQPVLTFATVRDLEAHLSSEPADSAGFWLRVSKIGAPETTIGKAEAIEVALCCGWIDGQLCKLDDHYFLVRMTPRRPGSRWSANNRATAERLALQGRLRPDGLAQIEAAKNDGRWAAAYASQGKAEIPQDLEAALALDEAAKRFFETLDRANRFAVIYRVNDAKRPEMRAKRIVQYVGMLGRGETIRPSKKATKAAS
ncbi:MAG: YdeI/OmpD-associated family protein [Ancalomicrobiaceae bacterium]|nr:YdeI/OmpD-associated family protein [Ancalomicrobiaceae bacterium]